LDIKQPADLTVLGNARDEARDTFQRLTSERVNGITKEGEITQAKERLKKVVSEYSGPSVKDATDVREASIDKGTKSRALVEKLESELKKAKAAVETCKSEYLAANATYEASKSHQSAVEELRSIASQTVSYPNESVIVEASHAVETATAAYDRGVRLRDVQKNQEKAKAHRDAAEAAEKAASKARNKAGQVFDILAQSLHTKHLEIHSVDGNPRLFVQHPKRGKTAFDRVNGLSDGERVDFTLRELLPHIESPGLLPIPQRVWQDLQPTDRRALHKLAVEKGLYLFGAQVDDGELRVAYLGGNGDE
jgi:hypothetical protein